MYIERERLRKCAGFAKLTRSARQAEIGKRERARAPVCCRGPFQRNVIGLSHLLQLRQLAEQSQSHSSNPDTSLTNSITSELPTSNYASNKGSITKFDSISLPNSLSSINQQQ